MANVNDITQSIQALRSETAPDSVSPERVGNLLQAIVDLIKALSMVPEEEIVSIMQAVNNAVSTANAANTAAANALSAANDKYIASVEITANGTGATFSIKQTGHSAKSAGLPVADGSHAGIVLPATLQDISDAAALAAKNKLTEIARTYNTTSLILTFRDRDGATLYTLTLPGASLTKAGLLSAADKNKLDNLPDNGVAELDDAGRLPSSQAPTVMLRRTYPSNYDEDPLKVGEFFIGDNMHIWFHQSAQTDVDLGVPSKNVVYMETDTNILYRWNGSAFVPALTDPNYAMQIVEVRRNNNTQKIYTVPNGKLARMIVNTVDVNVVLTPAVNGASVHRMIFSTDIFSACENINWPSGLVWKNGEVPTAEIVDENFGILVTIYDMKWAEFNIYSE